MRHLVALALLLAAASLEAQTARSASPIDWSALQSESVQHLRNYIRVNTTNPPGNEIEGALFLKQLLEREGIEAMILDTTELGVGHANL